MATRSSDRCMYPSKQCLKNRARKLNGQLHKLCEEHRQQANRNQKRLQQRRRLQQLHDLQLYVLDSFAQTPEPHNHAFGAFTYRAQRVETCEIKAHTMDPIQEPATFDYSHHHDSTSTVFEPYRQQHGFYDGTHSSKVCIEEDKGYYRTIDWDSITPLRLDEDESVRALTAEDIYILRALLLDS